jgi:hypothetical protein
MNLGSCATSTLIVRRDRGPLPTNKGRPSPLPIRAAVDQWRNTQTRFDRSVVEIYPTFPLDLNLVLNSQFNTKLITHFIIDQHIEKICHNSKLRTMRFNNYHAHFYSEIDSYLIFSH